MNDPDSGYQAVQDALRWRKRVNFWLWLVGTLLVVCGALALWLGGR